MISSETLASLRPADETPAAIWGALDAITAERRAVHGRMDDRAAQRGRLMLEAPTAEIRRVEEAARADELVLLQLDAMTVELGRRLDAARAAELAATWDARVADAAAKTDAWNRWFRTSFAGLAAGLAEGLRLESEAWRAREALRDDQSRMPPGLPEIARVQWDRSALARLAKMAPAPRQPESEKVS